MDKEEFLELVSKHLGGEASGAEEELLFNFYERLQERGQDWDTAQMGEETEVRKRIYGRITQEVEWRQRKRAFSSLRLTVVASVLAALISSVLFLYLRHSNNQVAVEQTVMPAVVNDTPQGGNKVTLTLANGSEINLDDAADGELARQSGTSITKVANGQLVYIVVGSPLNNDSVETDAYNAIHTPKGGQYQVVLPDGSRVWLNSASSLRYPVRFAGQQRRVELTGEAYFEVAKNTGLPFLVVSKEQVVEVIGTHFNVSAYADEATTETTLLEGVVSVSTGKASRPELLAPGQQALINQSDSSILVRHVDVDEAVAWKNGLFYFDNKDIATVMRQLERWYGIEVHYSGKVSSRHFSGIISRDTAIDKVLEMLTLTGGVQFRTEGRRVVVSTT